MASLKYGYIKNLYIKGSIAKFTRELNHLEESQNISKSTLNKLEELIKNVSEKNGECKKRHKDIRRNSRRNVIGVIGAEFNKFFMLFNADSDKIKKQDQKKQLRKETKEKLTENLNNYYSENLEELFSIYRKARKAFKKEYKAQKLVSEMKECLVALGCNFDKYGKNGEVASVKSVSKLQDRGNLEENIFTMLRKHQFVEFADEETITIYRDKENADSVLEEAKGYLKELKQLIVENAVNEKRHNDAMPENQIQPTCRQYLKKHYKFLPISIIEMGFEMSDTIGTVFNLGKESVPHPLKKIPNRVFGKSSKAKGYNNLNQLLNDCKEDTFIFGNDKEGENNDQSVPFFERILKMYNVTKQDVEFVRYNQMKGTEIPEENKKEFDRKMDIYSRFQNEFIVPQAKKLYSQISPQKQERGLREYLKLIFNNNGDSGEYYWDKNDKENQNELIYYIQKASEDFPYIELRKKAKELLSKYQLNIPYYLNLTQTYGISKDVRETINTKLQSFDGECENWEACIFLEILKKAIGIMPPEMQEQIDKNKPKIPGIPHVDVDYTLVGKTNKAYNAENNPQMNQKT